MKFTKFILQNYRSIVDPIEIDLEKASIIPVIGVNEAGKTTLLEGILAFDKFNDSNNGGKHLENFENFYTLSDEPAIITAHVKGDVRRLHKHLKSLLEVTDEGEYKHNTASEMSEEIDLEEEIEALLNNSPLTDELCISRNLKTKKYSLNLELNPTIEKELCETVLRFLPYIHYFDDFRDSMEELIEIPKTKDEENQSKWVPYLKELFGQVDETLDFYSLAGKNPNQRDSLVRSAQRMLQSKLTQHWSNFNVEGGEPLTVELKYHHTDDIEFRIIEKIETKNGLEERFFNIKDRSKGFFWYFNFVMKIEFNPNKRSRNDQDTLYLLDEPGSFLHSSAQTKLCERLKSISNRNKVIFCTHSSNLLNPSQIPLNNILIAEKTSKGSTVVNRLNEISLSRKNSAFQPILNALQIKPIILDYDCESVVLLEGIYDYYSFNLFNSDESLNFFPGSGSDSIIHHISYMIFLGKNYSILWDNDKNGKESQEKALKQFGTYEGDKWIFYSLPQTRRKKVILQNLYEGNDLKFIRQRLGLPSNSSFAKTIASLFHSTERSSIVADISAATKVNFEHNILQVKQCLKSTYNH